MSIENPTLAHFSHFRHFSSLYSPLHLSRALYKSPIFMQNKPNFQKSQMNANLYNTTDYERKRDWTLGQNKPNSNPIKPNFRRARMNINSLITKDYRKNDDFAVRKNKANSNPISEKPKMNVYLYVLKDYEIISCCRLKKNKPNSKPIQTQFKPCPERSRMGQFQNTTPKEREEKKVSGKLLKKQFYYFMSQNELNLHYIARTLP